MVWWPPEYLVANPTAAPPEGWEDWQKAQLKRMQAIYQRENDYWRPTIEARREQENQWRNDDDDYDDF